MDHELEDADGDGEKVESVDGVHKEAERRMRKGKERRTGGRGPGGGGD